MLFPSLEHPLSTPTLSLPKIPLSKLDHTDKRPLPFDENVKVIFSMGINDFLHFRKQQQPLLPLQDSDIFCPHSMVLVYNWNIFIDDLSSLPNLKLLEVTTKSKYLCTNKGLSKHLGSLLPETNICL